MKITGLANNYNGMPDDGKEPILFWKGDETVYNTSKSIVIPGGLDVVWPEVELAVTITNGGHVFGIAMDITASSLDDRDVHLPKSKALRTFCPVGSVWNSKYNPNAELLLTVNGEIVQMDYIKNMRYFPEVSIKYIEKYIDLNLGDVIITGTPPHPYYNLQDGDVVVASIEDIGTIERTVKRYEHQQKA